MDFVTLNLRGRTFLFDKTCIGDKLLQNSLLLHLDETSPSFLPERNEFYFNRNADIFDCVLEYLSRGSVHVPRNICTVVIKADLAFWGVPLERIDLCCWKSFYQTEEDVSGIKSLLDYIPSDDPQHGMHQRSESLVPVKTNCCSSLKIHITNLYHRSTCSGKVWYAIQCVVILLSTAYSILSTVSIFRVPVKDLPPYPYAITSAKMVEYWSTQVHPAVVIADAVCNLFLMLDWIFRFCLAKSKKTFMKSFLNLVELCSWLTSWLTVLGELDRSTVRIPVTGDGAMGHFITFCWFVFGCIISMRLLRIFRLIVDNIGVQILLLSLKTSARELLLLATSFSSVVIVFALMMYIAEISSPSNSSCPNALVSVWWAIVTMTTVGYGDYYPTTPQGYAVGVLCSVCGILLLALPIAVTSSNFNDIYNFNKYRERYKKSQSKPTSDNKAEDQLSCKL
ncbi:potassium voltage-gated channel protein egl-36-like [Argopecten irradians]|uniref:potassium voltage-gated channel protein egl-36-like n=1 Tax=Argopecten irradians TaxID=31199 RepID=UPI00371EEC0D